MTVRPFSVWQVDELWTAECNFFDQVLDLANLDPHLALRIA